MKIKEIKIDGFRGITNSTFSFEDVNVFTGPNGAGKTSVLKAILFALTGQMDSRDVNDASDYAEAAIEFEDGSTISRKKKDGRTTVKVCGKTTTSTNGDMWVSEKLGAPIEAVTAVCDPDFYKSLDNRTLTELFLSIMPLKISFEKLTEFIKKNLGRPLSSDETDLLRGYFLEDVFGLDEIAAAEKAAKEDRRTAKKALKELEARSCFDGQLPAKTEDELKGELVELGKKSEQFRQYQKDFAAYHRAVSELDAAKKRLSALQDELNACKPAASPEKPLDALKSEKERYDEAAANASASMIEYKNQIKILKDMLDSLGTPTCPICEDLVCTTDKTSVKGKIEKQIETGTATVKKQEAYIEKCRAASADRERMIEQANKDQLETARREALEKQVKEFVLPVVPDEPAEVPEVDVAAESERINSDLAVWNAYRAAQDEEKKREAQAKRVCDLETLCAALDSKTGVRTTILESTLGPMKDLCNKKLSEIGSPMTVDINADDGIQMTMKSHKSTHNLGMSQLSAGEYETVIYLISSVVRELTGVPLICLDDLDRLDASSLAGLLKLLAHGGFEQVFAACVDHPDALDELNGAGCNLLTL